MKKPQYENLKLTESGQNSVLTAELLTSEKVSSVVEPSHLKRSTKEQRR